LGQEVLLAHPGRIRSSFDNSRSKSVARVILFDFSGRALWGISVSLPPPSSCSWKDVRWTVELSCCPCVGLLKANSWRRRWRLPDSAHLLSVRPNIQSFSVSSGTSSHHSRAEQYHIIIRWATTFPFCFTAPGEDSRHQWFYILACRVTKLSHVSLALFFDKSLWNSQ
jgi:hypothetical protein